MKKTILLVMLVVLGAAAANAQWYAGGSLGFWSNDDDDATRFSIVPEVGYNINSKWAVGAELGFTYAEGKNEEGIDYDTNIFHVAPYARYTYFTVDKVNLFIDGGFGFSTVKDGDDGFQIGLKPGIALNLTEKFSLVAKFGFVGYSDDYMTGNLSYISGYENGFGLDLKNSLSFGFFVNF